MYLINIKHNVKVHKNIYILLMQGAKNINICIKL